MSQADRTVVKGLVDGRSVALPTPKGNDMPTAHKEGVALRLPPGLLGEVDKVAISLGFSRNWVLCSLLVLGLEAMDDDFTDDPD